MSDCECVCVDDADLLTKLRWLRADVYAGSVACRLMVDMLVGLAAYWCASIPVWLLYNYRFARALLLISVLSLCSARLQMAVGSRSLLSRYLLTDAQRLRRTVAKQKKELREKTEQLQQSTSCTSA